MKRKHPGSREHISESEAPLHPSPWGCKTCWSLLIPLFAEAKNKSRFPQGLPNVHLLSQDAIQDVALCLVLMPLRLLLAVRVSLSLFLVLVFFFFQFSLFLLIFCLLFIHFGLLFCLLFFLLMFFLVRVVLGFFFHCLFKFCQCCCFVTFYTLNVCIPFLGPHNKTYFCNSCF